MRDVAAVVAALDMSHNPSSVRLAQRAALPQGTPYLLEIAAGDSEAIDLASKQTGRSEERLREAAGFFIEQVLLHPESDSYRILGGASGTPAGELRRNMALLLRWLHPDVATHGADSNGLDRSVFANRVTQAWEDLKTEDRRASYDQRLLAARRAAEPQKKPREKLSSLVLRHQHAKVRRIARTKAQSSAPRRLAKREDVLTRFVRLLLGDRR